MVFPLEFLSSLNYHAFSEGIIVSPMIVTLNPHLSSDRNLNTISSSSLILSSDSRLATYLFLIPMNPVSFYSSRMESQISYYLKFL